jgi:uncharacterized oligopeptide transporter (OPT) family protein
LCVAYLLFIEGQSDAEKIIKEQLAFPSGTATAQLISVLHRMPPPDTTVRRRSGYRAIDTEDLTHPTAIADEPENHQEAAAEDDFNEREVVQREGWEDLLMSFLASGAMTVCSATITFTGYI